MKGGRKEGRKEGRTEGRQKSLSIPKCMLGMFVGCERKHGQVHEATGLLHKVDTAAPRRIFRGIGNSCRLPCSSI